MLEQQHRVADLVGGAPLDEVALPAPGEAVGDRLAAGPVHDSDRRVPVRAEVGRCGSGASHGQNATSEVLTVPASRPGAAWNDQ